MFELLKQDIVNIRTWAKYLAQENNAEAAGIGGLTDETPIIDTTQLFFEVTFSQKLTSDQWNAVIGKLTSAIAQKELTPLSTEGHPVIASRILYKHGPANLYQAASSSFILSAIRETVRMNRGRKRNLEYRTQLEAASTKALETMKTVSQKLEALVSNMDPETRKGLIDATAIPDHPPLVGVAYDAADSIVAHYWHDPRNCEWCQENLNQKESADVGQ